ncbi:MAG: SMI1/KNR4 family protein [Granulosicoccaceae bacterium]
MSALTKQLDSLRLHLQSFGMPTLGHLQPGLDSDAVVSVFKSVGLVPTAEIVELYNWSNGVTEDGGILLDDIHFIPGFYLMSIGESIAHLKANKGDARWSEKWWPILANGGGDFYAVDLSQPSNDGDSSPVIKFMLGYPKVDIEYTSIQTLIKTFVECCDLGIVYMDGGYLEMDDAKQYVVAKRNNPDVDFWQEAS